jgi:alpha-beta hydrolase superfamily lysophospholipase
MIEAIKKAGGTNAKLTIYPGVSHNSWSKTYANEKVYEWLLSHSSNPKKVDE